MVEGRSAKMLNGLTNRKTPCSLSGTGLEGCKHDE